MEEEMNVYVDERKVSPEEWDMEAQLNEFLSDL